MVFFQPKLEVCMEHKKTNKFMENKPCTNNLLPKHVFTDSNCCFTNIMTIQNEKM